MVTESFVINIATIDVDQKPMTVKHANVFGKMMINKGLSLSHIPNHDLIV